MIFKNIFYIMILNISLLACAGGWDFNQKEFIFLEKREMPFSNISEDIKSPNIYNTILWNYEKENKEKNLKEWQKQLDNKFSLEQIEDFVYKRKNLELIKNRDILDYLEFVNSQEKHVTNGYYSKKDLANLKDYNILLNEAISKIDQVNSKWLKLRYFYLALRIAHFKNKNPLDIYFKYNYLLKDNTQTIVKHWIQGLYAGALIKNNQIVKGVYEFTKLFDEKTINWHLSYYNFHHIKTNEQWDELVNLAKDDEEKTKLYAIRSLNKNSNILEELENIYSINKNSKWFDFLLYRNLLDTQHFFDQNSDMVKVFPYKRYIQYLEKLQKDDMYLVNLSLAYFNLYENNIEKAKEIQNNLSTKYPNTHEVETLEYILYLRSLKSIDNNIENDIYEKMSKLIKYEKSSTSIHDYTFVILEKLYLKQNDKFNAFLAKNIDYLNESIFDLELLEKFNTFISSPKESKIQEYITNKYLEQNMLRKVDNTFVLNDTLLRTRIKLLINNLKFEEALKIDSKYLDEKIPFNPFNGFIKGDNRKGKKYPLTVKEFLEKILSIKNELIKNSNSMMDNYLYANALYNLSYFGNSTILTTVYKSYYSFTDLALQNQKIDLASKHYNKALEYTKKDEFKAKIVYMLAKIELASYDIKFSTKTKDYFNKDLQRVEIKRSWNYYNNKEFSMYIKNDYGKYFDILKNSYSNTNYYNELIKECANLRLYEKSK